MPLRILHVAAFGPGAWAYGGIPRVVGAVTRGLATRGHRVTLCVTDAHDGDSRLPGSRGPWASPASVPAHGVDTWVFPNFSNVAAYHLQACAPRGLRRFLATHARTFDVAHVHGCHHVPGVFAARALRAAGVPFVAAPNGTAPIFERRLMAKRLFDRLGGRRVLADAARVLAVSDAEARQFRDLGIPAERIRQLPNPLDQADLDARVQAGEFRRARGLGDAPVVLFLGKITPRKHVDTLVRAFAAMGHSDAQLVIAGNDLGALGPARAAVRELRLGRRVHEVGLLRGAARLAALADADVVAYASSDEVFGLVACEGLLVGTPVVVANDSGCAEVVARTGGGLSVPPRDVPALAEALGQVLTNRAWWRASARRASDRVRSHYAEPVVAAQLEQIYDDLLSSRDEAVRTA